MVIGSKAMLLVLRISGGRGGAGASKSISSSSDEYSSGSSCNKQLACLSGLLHQAYLQKSHKQDYLLQQLIAILCYKLKTDTVWLDGAEEESCRCNSTISRLRLCSMPFQCCQVNSIQSLQNPVLMNTSAPQNFALLLRMHTHTKKGWWSDTTLEKLCPLGPAVPSHIPVAIAFSFTFRIFLETTSETSSMAAYMFSAVSSALTCQSLYVLVP